MKHLLHRPRRLRQHSLLRDMVRENHLSVSDLVYPMFVDENLSNAPRPINSMPGNYRHTIDSLLKELEEVAELKIPALLLFGIPKEKDSVGSSGYDEQGIVQEALRAIRKRFDQTFYLITDVCNCEYTDHGHCGILDGHDVNNDLTLDLLVKASLSHVRAGADMVAPSDMMDGRIGFIRDALDEAGFTKTPIMAYSAKYASSFYGPFRDAADSAPQFGDRRTYQMDPANGNEALQEVALDLEQGADIVMVKPAMAYMDIIQRVSKMTTQPVAVYNVSGEFAMVKAAAEKGWIDEKKVVLETMTGFKRAGADLILTYHAKDVARWLLEE